MKEKLLNLLACPVCGGDIETTHISIQEESEIIEGELSCCKCEAMYAVIKGVPRFASLSEDESDKAATAENFGWQWTNFTQEDKKYAEQFLGWLQPVRPEFFDGKLVLEGGCGKGRHTVLAHEWGAKEIVGIDLSDAVESAFAATRHLPNSHIVQADIFKLPFKKKFDYAFSVGVLHHTPDPKKAFKSLSSKVVQDGHISAWIYGQENNEWITSYIDPLRTRFTSRIGRPTLFQLSKLPTIGVFLASKLIYRPVNKASENLGSKLFYNDYLNHIGTFGWREQHNIVFDHLVAPTAYYISRKEFEEWWDDIGASDVEITWHNRNSWAGFGRLEKSK
jgi:SAM-dependent methyltransferase